MFRLFWWLCLLALVAQHWGYRSSAHFPRRNVVVWKMMNDRPFNNVVTPSYGPKKSSVQKFLMMYTCKICESRNAQMISKIAYTKGMVVATCKSCRQMHLIADNQEKMDMPEMPKRIEHYLENLGERVQKMQITERDLEKYLIVEKDGEIALYPKAVGPPPDDFTIIDVPTKRKINPNS